MWEALEAPAEYDGGTFYMLLMGTDKSAAREQSTQYAGDTFRSDSMILTRVDPQNKKVTMVSMHRDTEIEIEGYGLQKLNASYAIGGPALAIKTVSQMAGVPISTMPRSTSTASRRSWMPWAAWKWMCPWRSTTTRPADMWMRASRR